MSNPIFLLLLVLAAILPMTAFGYSRITKTPIGTVRIHESENGLIQLSDHFVGQDLKFSAAPRMFVATPPYVSLKSCSAIVPDKETVTNLVMYEDVERAATARVAYVATSSGNIYKINVNNTNTAACRNSPCTSNKETEDCQVTWQGQSGNSVISIYTCNGVFKMLVGSSSDTDCLAESTIRTLNTRVNLAVPFYNNLLVVITGDRLSVLNYQDRERVVYINIDDFQDTIGAVVAAYPLVAVMERQTRIVRLLSYDDDFEDMSIMGSFFIPAQSNIQQLYITLYEKNLLLAVPEDSADIYVYNIADPTAPELVKVYTDTDFFLTTYLPLSKARVAMSSDYIVVLGGSVNNLVLRVIGKRRNMQNYILADIPLKEDVEQPGVVVHNYHFNTFLVILGNTTRAFTFQEPMIVMPGARIIRSRNNYTRIEGRVWAKNFWRDSEDNLSVYVYPSKMEHSPLPSDTTPKWIGYHGHWTQVQLSSYIMASALNLISTERGRSISVEQRDKVRDFGRIAEPHSVSFAQATRWGGELILAQANKVGTVISVEYARIGQTGVVSIRNITSIDYEHSFNILAVAFSQSLRNLFVLTKYALSSKVTNLIYYAGYDSKLFQFVDQCDPPVGTCGSCLPVKLEYDPDAGFLFSGLTCVYPCTPMWYIVRYTLGQGSPTTVVDKKELHLCGEYLLDFYAASPVYSAYVTSPNLAELSHFTITFTNPYFQNEYYSVHYPVENFSYVDSYYSRNQFLVIMSRSLFEGYVIREYIVSIPLQPIHKRDIPIPPDYFLVYSGKRKGIIAHFHDNLLILVTTCKNGLRRPNTAPINVYCLLVYNLAAVEHNALYAIYETDIESSQKIKLTSMDVLPADEEKLLVLLFTESKGYEQQNFHMYRYWLYKSYDLQIRTDQRPSPSDNLHTLRLNATLNSIISHETNITVEVVVDQIPAPRVFNLSTQKIHADPDVGSVNISSYVTGYDTAIEILSGPGSDAVSMQHRELSIKRGYSKRRVNTITMGVEFVLPLENGFLLYIKGKNDLHVHASDRGQIAIQSTAPLSEAKIAFMFANDTHTYFVLYTNSMAKSKPGPETPEASVQPRIRIAWLSEGKVRQEKKYDISFDDTTYRYSIITKIVYDERMGILYVLVAPRAKQARIPVGHAILTYRFFPDVDAEPKRLNTFTENDFSPYIGSFVVTDACVISPSLILMIANFGYVNLTYSSMPGLLVEINSTRIDENYTYFRENRRVARIGHRDGTLYLLYSSSGIMYRSMNNGGEFKVAPVNESRSALSGLFINEKYVMFTRSLTGNDSIMIYDWYRGWLVPMIELRTDDICDELHSAWIERGSADEPTISVFFHCDDKIYTMIVSKWTLLAINGESLPRENVVIRLNITNRVKNEHFVFKIEIDNRASMLGPWLYCTLGVVVALGTIATSLWIWLRNKRRRDTEEGEKKQKFLFGELPSERPKRKPSNVVS